MNEAERDTICTSVNNIREFVTDVICNTHECISCPLCGEVTGCNLYNLITGFHKYISERQKGC